MRHLLHANVYTMQYDTICGSLTDWLYAAIWIPIVLVLMLVDTLPELQVLSFRYTFHNSDEVSHNLFLG